MTLSFVLFAVYIAVIAVVTWKTSRQENPEDFMISGRKLNAFRAGISITAGWTGGYILFSIAAIAYGGGAIIFLFSCGVVLGFVFLMFIGHKIQHIAAQEKIYTLPALIGYFFGGRTLLLTSFITLFIYALFVIMELIAGASILSLLSGFSYQSCLLFFVLIVAAYMISGGFSVILRTDLIQFLIIVLMTGGFLIFGDYGAVEADIPLKFMEEIRATPFWAALGTVIIVLPAFIITADLWQRLYAAKSGSHVRGSLVFAAVFLVLLLTGLTLLAMATGTLETGLSDREVFPKAMELFLPSWLLPFMAVVFMAVIMSSLDSFAFVAGQCLANDGFCRFLPDAGLRPKFYTRLGILAVLVITAAVALMQPDITTLLFLVIYLYSSMMPVMYGLLLEKPPSGHAVFWAVFLSVLSNTVLFFTGQLTDWISVGIMAAAMIFPFVYDRIFSRA
ncbi:MAG: hypothetical protein H6853_07495 [Rhodospirillales bacterium]|nr:hypothetical protein [Alphaproteobacteria bacterium]USO03368.1 MAG: hypothetical protein H6853_07495 [Rhodospirillales bacterium]